MCSFLPFNFFHVGKSGISEKENSEDEIEEENQRVITILRQQNSIKMIYMKIAYHCISRVNLDYLFVFNFSRRFPDTIAVMRHTDATKELREADIGQC